MFYLLHKFKSPDAGENRIPIIDSWKSGLAVRRGPKWYVMKN
jgi:hypothetical protein